MAAVNEKIIEKAKELGQLVKDDDATKRYTLAEIAVNSDLGLQYMLREFNEKRNKMFDLMSSGNEDKAVIDPLNDEIKKLYDEIMANKTMAELNAAKDELDKILNQINSIINFYVTGEESGGCSPDKCASCHGCH